jgi:RND superfamily putative drug exporter
MDLTDSLYRRRWIAAAAWPAVAVALALLVPRVDPMAVERRAFLPPDAPSRRAARELARAFPERAGLSEAVVVFERRGGRLTSDDLDAIARVAEKAGQAGLSEITPDELARATIRSPGDIPLPAAELPGGLLPRNPLVSPAGDEGQAALILIHVPASFITLYSARVVDHLHAAVRATRLPEGLCAAVTGSSGFGHDYAAAAQRSNRRTMFVTVAAVVCILLLVYRAPLAAMIPLTAISLAAVAALSLLRAGEHGGLHVGTAEEIFAFVLLYGAGTDYSLLLISRCRERLASGRSPARAVPTALAAVFPALAASAGTDAAGLLMLSFAEYEIFRTAGPAIAIAIGVALLAVLTLVPALLGIFGRAVFWPARTAKPRRRFWTRVAAGVTARPGLVLLAVLPLLAVPAIRGAHLRWVYDTLAQVRVRPGAHVGGAAEGLEMARRHWPAGQVAPVRILLKTEQPQDAEAWRKLSERLTGALMELDGVRDVRSLSQPLGSESAGAGERLLAVLGATAVRDEYVGADGRAMRLEAALGEPAMTRTAMAELRRVREVLEAETAEPGLRAKVLIGGATAQTDDIRSVTRSDFHRVATLVLGVIFLVVLLLLRDALLAAMMVASTVLSYLATLGISHWVFTGLLGSAGLDWKVQVFLFVVIAAVGVDYNIFLAARYAEESRRHARRRAMRRALTFTGPVISSAGVIMAATLGSLMAGELVLMHQLGFALATGMLIDTFISRPLVLPAFIVLTRRKVHKAKMLG